MASVLFLLLGAVLLFAPLICILLFIGALILFRKTPQDTPERSERLHTVKLTGILSLISVGLLAGYAVFFAYGMAHM